MKRNADRTAHGLSGRGEPPPPGDAPLRAEVPPSAPVTGPPPQPQPNPRETAGMRREATAREAWAAMEDVERVQLLHDVIQTRASELRRAYKDLIGVGLGYRTAESPPKLVEPRQHCLIFTVKKKWLKEPRASAQRRLPSVLYTHAIVRGARTLCAIPTDVQAVPEEGEIRPHGNSQVLAQDAVGYWCLGMACAMVQFGASGPFLLSCHHVLAMSDQVPSVPPAVTVSIAQGRAWKAAGRLSGFFGGFDTAGSFFDAALADSQGYDALLLGRSVVEPLRNAKCIQSASELFVGGKLYVHAPDGRRIEGEFRTVHYDYLVPSYGELGDVRLQVVAELKATGLPGVRGDSGSPVFDGTGTVFQGMYVAGSVGGIVLFIPAYELLRAANFGMTAGDEMLRLV